MAAATTPWRDRVLRVFLVTAWVGLSIGIFVDFVRSAGSIQSIAAAAAAGTYVVALTVSFRFADRRLVTEVVALSGTICCAIAVGLTGTIESPYLLLSLTPPIFAAVAGGNRLGLATSFLSAGLFLALALGQGFMLNDAVGMVVLFPLVALLVGQVTKILTDLEQRARDLEASSAVTAAQLERLERTHQMLGTVRELMEGGELNPITIGNHALAEITSHPPVTAATATINGERGPVVVGRSNVPGSEDLELALPLRVGDREVGSVTVASREPLNEAQIEDVNSLLGPVSLAFANVLLLQSIAREAVDQERLRLARELHDGIGPSLASLGLGLDLALLQQNLQPGVAAELAQLRGSVSGLVDDVRLTVSDLRSGATGTLTQRLQAEATRLAGKPDIHIELDERRAPRPSQAEDLAAMVVEAVRNAHRHSGGKNIWVAGTADFDRGYVLVKDDGHGFDPATVGSGHFGLMGIRERAARIGADLSIDSSPGGTTIGLRWEPA
ncbi:MAG TPA: histidine kinase [Acidimicrobiia bacterium]